MQPEFVNENTVMCRWSAAASEKQLSEISGFQHAVLAAFSGQLQDTVASYTSLMLQFDPRALIAGQLDDIEQQLLQLFANKESWPQNSEQSIHWRVPVYYGLEAGWDIEEVATTNHLTVEQVISLHTETEFKVYALGFTPGFAYLGHLPRALHCTRRATPRIKIPAGAVAIAADQSAIYPNVTPGGWRVIGQSPFKLLKHTEQGPTPVFGVNDSIEFYAVDLDTFLKLGGKLQLEQELNANRERLCSRS